MCGLRGLFDDNACMILIIIAIILLLMNCGGELGFGNSMNDDCYPCPTPYPRRGGRGHNCGC